MRRAGWGAWCAPAARVVHHEAQSTRQFRESMFVALWRSRLRLFAIHYGPLFNWAARPLIRWGVRRLQREAERGHRAGEIAAGGLARRRAFEEVAGMTRMSPGEFL